MARLRDLVKTMMPMTIHGVRERIGKILKGFQMLEEDEAREYVSRLDSMLDEENLTSQELKDLTNMPYWWEILEEKKMVNRHQNIKMKLSAAKQNPN